MMNPTQRIHLQTYLAIIRPRCYEISIQSVNLSELIIYATCVLWKRVWLNGYYFTQAGRIIKMRIYFKPSPG